MAEEKDKKTQNAAIKKTAAKSTAKPKAVAKTKASVKADAKAATAKSKKQPAAEKTAEKPEAKAKSTPKVKAKAKADTKPATMPAAEKKKAPKAEEKPKTTPKAAGKPGDYRPRLMDLYSDTVIPYMIEKFSYSNPNMVPKLDKISLNARVGNAKDDPKDLEMALDDLTTISGQKAVVTKAKKAIANFKIREGDPVGGRVTIRGKRMYEFLDRMISIAIPRVRDFTGLRQKSFDGFGNYSWGVKEQIIFPEIDYDKVEKIRGLDITIVTTANTDEEGFELLKAFGMPFRVHTEESEA